MVFSVRRAASDEKQVIHDLLQDYLEELSKLPGESIKYRDENGAFHYPYLDAYWQEEERFPYLLIADGESAGFALLRRDGDHWEMAEFYVKPQYRHRGIGFDCATLILREHPGTWIISFNSNNLQGGNLWLKLAHNAAGETVESGRMDANHNRVRFSTM